jgi:hypothetical protein
VAKHLKKHADGSAHGYTNDANPFNDTNVSERFVWGKKIEKQLREGADVREMTSKAERVRQEDRLVRLQQPRFCLPSVQHLFRACRACLYIPCVAGSFLS